MINGGKQNEADHKTDGDLNRKLVSSPDANAFLIHHLLMVIQKTEYSECQGGQENNPDIGIGQVGPEKSGDENPTEDKASSHGGGSILCHVSGGNVLSHHLLNLISPQLFDQPGTDDKTDEKSSQNRIDGPESDIPEDIKEGK